MILETIVEYKREKVARDRAQVPLAELVKMVENAEDTRDFKAALSKERLAVIAEVKKASPSKGVIREDFDPAEIARAYESCGVDAVSVLTEDKFFLGRDEYIGIVKGIVSAPVLRKDFIIDKYQIYQSRAIGADAVLLIASILSAEELRDFYETAKGLGLHCLVEVHSEEDLEKALYAGAEIIGINNRDLDTFETDIRTTQRLSGLIPEGKIIVSESGILSGDDARFVREYGADAILVGQFFMESDSIEDKLKELRGE